MIGQFYDLDAAGRPASWSRRTTHCPWAPTPALYFAPMVHWPEVMMTSRGRANSCSFPPTPFGTFGAVNGNLV